MLNELGGYMYIVEINNHGTICKEKFEYETDYNLFVQGVLFGLELTNIKYTYNETQYKVECVTKLTLDIL